MTPPEAIMDDPVRSNPYFFDAFNIHTAVLDGRPEILEEIGRSIRSKSPWTDIPPAVGDFYREQKQNEVVRELVGAYRHFGMYDTARALLNEYELDDIAAEQSADTESEPK